MKNSKILESLAQRYEQAVGGRTGTAKRDLIVSVEDLLGLAGAREGDERAIAERELSEAQAAGVLKLEPLHRRDHSFVHKVRFSSEQEVDLYARVGRQSPTELRRAVSQQFLDAKLSHVPVQWETQWQEWCDRMSWASLDGQSIQPFDRSPSEHNSTVLTLLPKLLAWEGESLVRFASCVLCDDSKVLESMAAIERQGELSGKLSGKLGRILSQITNEAIRSLDDLGIVATPRSVLVHGPIKLRIGEQWLDFTALQGAFRISQVDVDRAIEIASGSKRCITVENETSFHELAKLNSGELLVHTSFPGSATVAFLKRLPVNMEFWHFGDSDDAGFEIVRVLKEKSYRNFTPTHMKRGRMPFEQESLGRPALSQWPFYHCDCDVCKAV
jgi:hypothetical protein